MEFKLCFGSGRFGLVWFLVFVFGLKCLIYTFAYTIVAPQSSHGGDVFDFTFGVMLCVVDCAACAAATDDVKIELCAVSDANKFKIIKISLQTFQN